jgi:hypothetical protein
MNRQYRTYTEEFKLEALGYLSPAAFERQFYETQTVR